MTTIYVSYDQACHIDYRRHYQQRARRCLYCCHLHHATSDVAAGENKGRKLTETEVVLNLENIAKIAPGRGFSHDFELKLKSSSDPANLGLVIFAQASGTGKVKGAASVEKIRSIQPSTVSDSHGQN